MSGDRIDLLHRIKKLEQENEELRERATPMRVTDIHVDEFYCPNCGSEIPHDYDCQLPNFCKECGQRLRVRKNDR